MKDAKMLAAIRLRDADFDYIAPHWQAQNDRRFLLQMVDEVLGTGSYEEAEPCAGLWGCGCNAR